MVKVVKIKLLASEKKETLMIEYPQETTDDTNDYFEFGNSHARTLYLSNAGGAAALLRLTKDTGTIDSSNFDLSVAAGETLVIPNISVKVISAPTGQTVGIWRS